jgi:hypothetical protein
MTYYLNPDAAKEARRAHRNAAAFRPDERMERLIALRDSRDPQWQQLPAVLQIGVGLYESDKANHERVSGDAA